MEPVHLLRSLRDQCAALRATQTFSRGVDKAAVIVEPRDHPLLEAVVRNVMHYLGDGWTLRVFTSAANVDGLLDTLGSGAEVHTLERDNLTSAEYSQLLMSRAFWESIPEEHVLVFQTDAMLFRPGVDAWLAYDYVGANYYNPAHTAPKLQGVQGGLSLRRRQAMLDCLSKVSQEDVQRYRVERGLPRLAFSQIPEDVYFTHACEMLGMNVPSPEQRRLFSIEADFHPATLGHHGLKFPYLTGAQQQALCGVSMQLSPSAL